MLEWYRDERGMAQLGRLHRPASEDGDTSGKLSGLHFGMHKDTENRFQFVHKPRFTIYDSQSAHALDVDVGLACAYESTC
jgi:hypothetical protein